MTHKFLASILFSLILFAAVSFAEDAPATAPFVKQLPADSVHYTPLAEAEFFESGCVSLQPGEFGSEHSSMSWQEMLVVLKGEGETIIGGEQHLPIKAGEVVYIPQQTVHQLHCTGDTPLQYVYIAAKTVE